MPLRIHGEPAYLAHFLAVLLFCCSLPSCVCVINGKRVNGGEENSIATDSAGESIVPEEILLANSSAATTGARDPRIIRGRPVRTRGEFSYMAFVQTRPRYGDGSWKGCGGSIISSRFILTAAHCLQPKGGIPYKVRAVFLADWPSSLQNAHKFKACSFYVHPDYNRRFGSSDDIALIKLRKPIDLRGLGLEYLRLPSPDLQYPHLVGSFVSVTGWGASEHPFSNGLRTAYMQIKHPDVCSQYWRRSFQADGKQLCVFGHNGADTCVGDSGGPFVSSTTRGAPTVVGVVSFGLFPCRAHHPSVNTAVAPYVPWIRRTMSRRNSFGRERCTNDL